jgi:hypothetical protein
MPLKDQLLKLRKLYEITRLDWHIYIQQVESLNQRDAAAQNTSGACKSNRYARNH